MFHFFCGQKSVLGQNSPSAPRPVHVRSWRYSCRGGSLASTVSCSHKRKLARPKDVERWSMTTMSEKRVKIGAKVVRLGRYVTFQPAEVAAPWGLFRKILSLTDDLRPGPAPA